MKEFLFESTFDQFNYGPVEVTSGVFAAGPVLTGAALRRDDELDLILEFRTRQWKKSQPQRYPAGTVRPADEVIEFRHRAGWTGTAHGVVEHDTVSSSTAAGEPETVETFSVRSVEIDYQRQIRPSYVIEWVLNLPDGLIWKEPVRFSGTEILTKAVGTGTAEIRMTRSLQSSGGNQALHLRVAETDLYVMKTIERDDDVRSAGQIVYQGCPDQVFRQRVRTCLSFILGKPIIYLGYTEYCSDWLPTLTQSVNAFSIGGAAFRLHALPPYPINQAQFANVIDQEHVGGVVDALLKKYDAIKFDELSWSYWYAMCAPLHAAAVHFGSLIEQLQNNSGKVIEIRRSLLEADTWGALNGIILDWLKSSSIDPDILSILRGKVSGLNQAPADVVLRRVLETLGLSTSDAETRAWKQRNVAAHGGISDNSVELILNSKILRLLFHRLLAGITYCSDRYIDYYNLGHPVRALAEAVPGR